MSEAGTPGSVLLVGCGNMGGAMLEGWLAAGWPAGLFTVVDPARETAPGGVALLRELPAQGAFDIVQLGIKPQSLDAVAPLVEPLAGPHCTLVSLLAGVELDSLERRFPRAGALVRAMPNLAVALGKAPVALAALRLEEPARQRLERLLAGLGTLHWVPEADFELVTALAGSGPAFVYRFIDALGTAATRLGLDEAEARALALAMVEGAAALAARSGHSPGRLADMVASPGGVTREGLNVLDEGEALVRLMTATLRAARDRGTEMARAARD